MMTYLKGRLLIDLSEISSRLDTLRQSTPTSKLSHSELQARPMGRDGAKVGGRERRETPSQRTGRPKEGVFLLYSPPHAFGMVLPCFRVSVVVQTCFLFLRQDVPCSFDQMLGSFRRLERLFCVVSSQTSLHRTSGHRPVTSGDLVFLSTGRVMSRPCRGRRCSGPTCSQPCGGLWRRGEGREVKEMGVTGPG